MKQIVIFRCLFVILVVVAMFSGPTTAMSDPFHFDETPSDPATHSGIDDERWRYSGRTLKEFATMVKLVDEYTSLSMDKYRNEGGIPDIVFADNGDPTALADTLPTQEQAEALIQTIQGYTVQFPIVKWPRSTIFYTVDPHSYTEVEIWRLHQAFQWWEDATCLKFEYVFPQDIPFLSRTVLLVREEEGREDSCTSFVGYADKTGNFTQFLNIGSHCVCQIGPAVHAIGHALGLHHEHQRHDAAQFISILYENARSVEAAITSLKPIPYHKPHADYDYGSIMHYPPNAFAADNTSTTLQPIDPEFVHTIGQISQVTFSDAKAINAIYCTEKCSFTLDCMHGGYQDPKECSRCRCTDIYEGTLCERLKTSGTFACNPHSGPLPILIDNATVCMSTPRYTETFDGTYFPGDHCTWIIQVPKGCTTQLWVTDDDFREPEIMKIEDEVHDVCADWIEIRPTRKHGSGYRLCGHGIEGGFMFPKDDPLELAADSIIPVLFRSFEHLHIGHTHMSMGAELCYRLKDPNCLKLQCGDQCHNGGTCKELLTEGDYFCLCMPDYTGKNCTSRVDDCEKQPCLHGGRCRDGVGTYECTCRTGYRGHNCEINIDDCESSPCQHGGTCMDGENAYACRCPRQVSGKHCEHDGRCNDTFVEHLGQKLALRGYQEFDVEGFACDVACIAEEECEAYTMDDTVCYHYFLPPPHTFLNDSRFNTYVRKDCKEFIESNGDFAPLDENQVSRTQLPILLFSVVSTMLIVVAGGIGFMAHLNNKRNKSLEECAMNNSLHSLPQST